MVEPGGIENPDGPVQQLRPYSREWSQLHVQLPVPTGLPNLSADCYRNSVLYTLLHTPVFVNWIMLHWEHRERGPISPAGDPCLPCFLRVFFEEYWLHRESHLATWNHLYCLTSSVNTLGWESTAPNNQEDAVEYFTHILNIVNHQATLTNELDDAITQMFRFNLEYKATCEGCAFVKSFPPEKEFFLRAAISKKGKNNIKDAIYQYLTNAESEVSWICEFCNTENNDPRRCEIRNAPDVLLVQINRFTSDNLGDEPTKLRTAVEIPETLDIRDLGSNAAEIPDDEAEYQLFAAVYHAGEQMTEGHYYTYAQGPTGVWSKLNDDQVNEVEFSQVLNAQTDQDCVYVLAYRRTVVSERSAPFEIAQQPPNNQVAPQDETPAPSDERSVDVRTAEVSLDDRSLIGSLQGWMTLPGAQPLVMLQPRRRVMQATLDIDMSMGSSKLVGTLKGNLKPMQGSALNSGQHPPPTATAEGMGPPIPFQPAPTQPTLPQTAEPKGMGTKFSEPHETLPQEPMPAEMGAQKTDSKSQSGKLGKPKPVPSVKAPSKRKRGQEEDKQDVEGGGEEEPSTKRQKPGPKPKADKSDKSKSKKKKDSKKKEGDGTTKSKSKAGKLRREERREKEAAGEPAAGPELVAPSGEVDETSKPRQFLKIRLKGPQTGSNHPAVNPGARLNEGSREGVTQYRVGDLQHDQGAIAENPEGDIVEPPPQPPPQPPGRVKSQRAPKPPPREGTRKNPRRAGKKELD